MLILEIISIFTRNQEFYELSICLHILNIFVFHEFGYEKYFVSSQLLLRPCDILHGNAIGNQCDTCQQCKIVCKGRCT